MMLRNPRERVAAPDPIHERRRFFSGALSLASIDSGAAAAGSPDAAPVAFAAGTPDAALALVAAPFCALGCPTFAQPLTASATHAPARLANNVLSKRFLILFDSCSMNAQAG